MSNAINWKQYQQIREYLDTLGLDDRVVHSVALHAAKLGLKRIKLSFCRFNAERKTWRRHKREIVLTDVRAEYANEQSEVCKVYVDEETFLALHALDRYDVPTSIAEARKLLVQVTLEWGDYPVSLEDAAEMTYPGKGATREEINRYKRAKLRLYKFRKKWRKTYGTISTPR